MNNTTTNSTNTTSVNSTILSQSEAARIFKILFYIVLFLVGTIGNLLVVLIIKAKHKHRTVNDCFILNLAIADLTFLCFALPFYYYELFEKFTKFQFYCKFLWPMMSISLFVSIFTPTLMAVERCRAILFPFRPRIKKHTLFIGIVLIWTLSIICIVPLMVVSNADGVSCMEHWHKDSHRKAYTAVLFVLQFAIPVFIIAIAYITIAITLLTAKVPNRTSINNHGQLVKQKSRADNLHIIRTVAIIVLLFVICMLPNQIAWLLTDFGGEKYANLSAKFWLLAEALMFFHSCVNPIIYGSLTRQFREGYIKYIHFVCCCGRSRKRTIDLSDSNQNTKTRGTTHGRLPYRRSLKSPSTLNGAHLNIQAPTRITSCCLVTSRSPPSSARSASNSARSHSSSGRSYPRSLRSPPKSSRWHAGSIQTSSSLSPPGLTRLSSIPDQTPSPLIIDNKMTIIVDKMHSVNNEKTEVNLGNEIFSTNPIVHCKLPSDDKQVTTESETLPSELSVESTNFDVITSTVLENPHAEETATTDELHYDVSFQSQDDCNPEKRSCSPSSSFTHATNIDEPVVQDTFL